MVGAKNKSSKIHYGWIIILMGLLAGIGSNGFGRMAYTLILPEMSKGLGLTFTQAGLLASGNLTGYLIFALVGGLLSALYGSRNVIFLSLLLSGVAMLLTGMAESFEFALVMRLFTGIGNSGAYVPAMALGSTWFSTKKRGFATGIVTAGPALGICFSSVLVPTIINAYGRQGWSYAWFYLGGATIVISLICWIFLKDNPADLGLQQVGVEGKRHRSMELPSSVSGKVHWGYIFKRKKVWNIGVVYFMYGISHIIYTTFFKAFLLDAGVAGGAVIGAMWALVGGLNTFCGMIWGSVSDIIGRNYGAALAYLTLACSYIIFALFDSLVAFYISAILFGLSAWGIPPIMAAAVGDFVGKDDLATVGIGFITLFCGLGQVLGPLLGGCLRDITGTFALSFFAATLISILGLAGSLLLLE